MFLAYKLATKPYFAQLDIGCIQGGLSNKGPSYRSIELQHREVFNMKDQDKLYQKMRCIGLGQTK